MSARLHECPNCATVGRVHRSLPRTRREKVVRALLPVYGIYRCHNCNWRGWLPRGSTSATMRRLLIGIYAAILVILAAYAVTVLVERWPRPHYEYPLPRAN